MIKIKDKEFDLYISAESIAGRIKEVAADISRDYDGKDVMLLCVLKGAILFTSDLIRELSPDYQLTFIKLKSYEGMSSSGNISIDAGLSESIKEKHVIIIEDIVDTGSTLQFLIEKLKVEAPASVNVCTLLRKPEAAKHTIDSKYVCFDIENKFVVGYGLDYDEEGRGLKDIYQLIV